MKDTYANVEDGSCIHLMELGPPASDWMITSVGVQRSLRGRGAAGRLLDLVLAEADAEGTLLILSVQPDGTGLDEDTLRAFYGRRGFRLAPLLEDAVMYRWPGGVDDSAPAWLT